MFAAIITSLLVKFVLIPVLRSNYQRCFTKCDHSFTGNYV